jgi:hypothetical protein
MDYKSTTARFRPFADHTDVMKPHTRYDLIGDIHGHNDKLTALLDRLGYLKHHKNYRHPEGRKVVFLGDYIDRGPKIRETLHTVRNMVDAGEAHAIMGNHEFNAVAYATLDGQGNYLREHKPANVSQHAATLAAFAGHEDEWAGWLDWMKGLPMFLDLGDLRAVHAAWDNGHIEFLGGKTLLEDDFLVAAGTRGTLEYTAVELVLKGPELKLPDGVSFFDKEGKERSDVRLRWWNLEEGMPINDLVMPTRMEHMLPLLGRDELTNMTNYPADAVPVLFGHYWMPPHAEKAPLAPNIACLDYSGAFGDNPICAYRWDGENKLTAANFITTHPHE